MPLGLGQLLLKGSVLNDCAVCSQSQSSSLSPCVLCIECMLVVCLHVCRQSRRPRVKRGLSERTLQVKNRDSQAIRQATTCSIIYIYPMSLCICFGYENCIFPLVSELLSALRHYSVSTTRMGAAISDSTYLPKGRRQGASHPAPFAKPFWIYSSKHYGGRRQKGKMFPKVSLRKCFKNFGDCTG